MIDIYKSPLFPKHLHEMRKYIYRISYIVGAQNWSIDPNPKLASSLPLNKQLHLMNQFRSWPLLSITAASKAAKLKVCGGVRRGVGRLRSASPRLRALAIWRKSRLILGKGK